mmetsp:Transcript_4350/g.9416  ORF Transcript_4350/g.9416 Transcript_4350/m.9416 type:complete len:264 (-) Transcript_4350:586-1377(-)
MSDSKPAFDAQTSVVSTGTPPTPPSQVPEDLEAGTPPSTESPAVEGKQATVAVVTAPAAEPAKVDTVEEVVLEERSWAIKFGLFFRKVPHKENENVVRARAGMLQLIATVACTLLITALSQELADESMRKEKWGSLSQRLPWVIVFVMADFVLATLFGMAACPLGMAGTVMSVHFLKQKPVWKPAAPKRFAWFLGFLMTLTCLTTVLVWKNSMRKVMLGSLASVCIILTYLEAALGFCAGCWMFRKWGALKSKITGEEPAKCG